MPGDWTVRLAGDDRSLQGLEAWLTQEQLKVSRGDDGSYYLTSPDLTACGTNDEAWTVAQRMVDYINSATRLLEPGHVPAEIRHLIQTEPDGTQHKSLRLFPKAGVGVGRGVRPDCRAAVTPGPPLLERIVHLQEREGSDSPVARALVQWNLSEQTPTSLNNILEIIRDDASGGDRDVGRAWRTTARTMAPLMGVQEAQLDADLRRCRDSLHDPTTVGPTARHGSPRPVSNPMTLEQARDFICRILLTWLRSRI